MTISPDSSGFVAALRAIVGARQVLTDAKATRSYRTGFRCGGGRALAVVRPRSLVELWKVLQACVAANQTIIMQAANTGLTGGSTPIEEGYDREVVIINTMALAKLYVIDEGRQVICLAGATLYQLEKALEPYGRDPHSVIGSSCIGASVIGGICNNSGGALIRRGPAYTQMALYARISERGELELVNHLGVALGPDPEQMLARLDRGEFGAAHIEHDLNRCGSDVDYETRLRNIDSDEPARFNADPQRLFAASGSAGKIAAFGVARWLRSALRNRTKRPDRKTGQAEQELKTNSGRISVRRAASKCCVCPHRPDWHSLELRRKEQPNAQSRIGSGILAPSGAYVPDSKG